MSFSLHIVLICCFADSVSVQTFILTPRYTVFISLFYNLYVNIVMFIREFAEEEGISGELLDTVVDPSIVKFVDDYRRLKQGVTKGQAKRKTTTVKKAPIKKAKTRTQKQVDEAERVRQRALSEDSSNEDQMAFLRSMANRSLNL